MFSPAKQPLAHLSGGSVQPCFPGCVSVQEASCRAAGGRALLHGHPIGLGAELDPGTSVCPGQREVRPRRGERLTQRTIVSLPTAWI
jgi:hypothetical protein